MIDSNIKFNFDTYSINELVEILLDNALKHADKKSTIKEQGNNILLSVTDTGDIIPKREEEKIFERFYRLDKSRSRKENRYGLGLAIAKNIVNNYNGKILVECEKGYTTFKIIF